jgi:hypothetical protein
LNVLFAVCVMIGSGMHSRAEAVVRLPLPNQHSGRER